MNQIEIEYRLTVSYGGSNPGKDEEKGRYELGNIGLEGINAEGVIPAAKGNPGH